jgi:arylsulfatase A
MNKFMLTVFGFASMMLIAQNSIEKPNIVLIMADDLGYECLNSYGGTSYNTPNLSVLANTGMQFENCHSQPICTPSRVKLMTGKSNKKNHIEFGYLDPKEKTFSQILRKSGYATLIAGKWQLGTDVSLPNHFGFDEHLLWQLSTTGRDSLGRDKRYVNPVLEQNGELYEKNEGR